jgi:hypothetical protein
MQIPSLPGANVHGTPIAVHTLGGSVDASPPPRVDAWQPSAIAHTINVALMPGLTMQA